jgi:NAD(P)-dependent dehydrogenase (short-subunit alcohol dehydrogenase family)
VNLKSVMLTGKFAIPHLRAAGGGAIINIASISALRGFGSAVYAASKGGMISLTIDMAFMHGLDGVRVNCIAPGQMDTPLARGHRIGGSAPQRAAQANATLLGVDGNAWDVAWAAVYLASDEARWVTGVVLPIDGGTTMGNAYALRDRYSSPA